MDGALQNEGGTPQKIYSYTNEGSGFSRATDAPPGDQYQEAKL